MINCSWRKRKSLYQFILTLLNSRIGLGLTLIQLNKQCAFLRKCFTRQLITKDECRFLLPFHQSQTYTQHIHCRSQYLYHVIPIMYLRNFSHKKTESETGRVIICLKKLSVFINQDTLTKDNLENYNSEICLKFQIKT